MKYIILDLEATCWEGRSKDKTSEIIEIGAVAINENREKMGEFCAFVKPKLHPQLSDFCMSLTTISQAEIDKSRSFPAVLADFQSWINIQQEPYSLCSWGYYDKNQLEKDCKLHQLDTKWLTPHLSVKHQYQNLKGLKKAVGMSKALSLEGFTLEGTHHRGIDDARNITKVFLQYFGEWKLL